MNVHLDPQRNDSTVDLASEWSTAYEFLVSFGCFAFASLHPILEIGQSWVRQVRHALPAAYVEQISQKAFIAALKEVDHDLLMILVRACPDTSRQDAPRFLDWLANLSPGDAYEALAPRLPESGPQLPRDFGAWRDRMVEVLRIWDSAYFQQLDHSRSPSGSVQRQPSISSNRSRTACASSRHRWCRASRSFPNTTRDRITRTFSSRATS